MKKSELAEQLREKQLESEMNDQRKFLQRIKDDAIIDDYITCDGCGEKHIEKYQLDKIISDCKSADDFFQALDDLSEKEFNKHHLNQDQ